jgi:hypothetical protein
MNRIQRSELSWIQVTGPIEESVVEPDEMDAGQKLAGFWNQAREAGAAHNPHQLDSQERCRGSLRPPAKPPAKSGRFALPHQELHRC